MSCASRKKNMLPHLKAENQMHKKHHTTHLVLIINLMKKIILLSIKILNWNIIRDVLTSNLDRNTSTKIKNEKSMATSLNNNAMYML